MADTVDDRWIVNRSLARIGSSPIGSLDEETAKARQCVAVYYDRRDQVLARYPWNCNRLTYKLDAIAEIAPNGFDANNRWGNGWRYAYAMPGTALGPPRKVLDNPLDASRPLRDHLHEGERIYANVRNVWAVVPVAAAPAVWPAYLRLAIIVLGAADLAVPIAHDKTLAEALREQGEGTPSEKGLGGLIGQAIIAEVSGSPQSAPLLADDPLTTAHLS